MDVKEQVYTIGTKVIDRALLMMPTASRVLLAVSGGVDSMVLLSVIQRYAQQTGLVFGVAHINHGLREASIEEERFLRAYCQKQTIPFYGATWQPTTSNVEANARKFRYDFFEQIMREQGYGILLTAHHSDDQVETMLMKLIREGELSALKGILEQQPFGSEFQLLRPFLRLSKAEIYQYAKTYTVPFFEDETNTELTYFRNRVRQQVVPVLKKENLRLAEHFQRVADQLVEREQLLEEVVWHQDKQLISIVDDGYEVSLCALLALQTKRVKYFIQTSARLLHEKKALLISKQQQEVIFEQLYATNGQWTLQLAKNWWLRRVYDTLKLEHGLPKQNPSSEEERAYHLSLGSSVFLTEDQWIGYFEESNMAVPEHIKYWETVELSLVPEVGESLIVRKRAAGDRLQLTPTLNKRVSRWLIDQKIPNEFRDAGWFVEDFHKNGLVFLPFIHSCLSISEETDKIRYVLLYKYRK